MGTGTPIGVAPAALESQADAEARAADIGEESVSFRSGKFSASELKTLSVVNVTRSIQRCAIYAIGCAVAWLAIARSDSPWVLSASVLVLGVLYAHGLELQHQCLHGSLFRSVQLSRFVGFLLGAPMLVSYTQYRSMHLFHHKYLGTAQDEEIFNYDEASLSSWGGFCARAWNVRRIPAFFATLRLMLRGDFHRACAAPKTRRHLLVEYSILTVLLVAAIVWSVVTQSKLLLLGWFVPWLLVGEVAHFLFELPEHLFLDRSTPNVLHNTRTVRASAVMQYLTNRNNFHVEHHMYPGVAMENLHLVHQRLRDELKEFCDSYVVFYRRVLRRIGHAG